MHRRRRPKPQNSLGAGESFNPVAVLRFLCRACERACSRLPACIAPRRWYNRQLGRAASRVADAAGRRLGAPLRRLHGPGPPHRATLARLAARTQRDLFLLPAQPLARVRPRRFSNRPVRTRMPGGVGEARPATVAAGLCQAPLRAADPALASPPMKPRPASPNIAEHHRCCSTTIRSEPPGIIQHHQTPRPGILRP